MLRIAISEVPMPSCEGSSGCTRVADDVVRVASAIWIGSYPLSQRERRLLVTVRVRAGCACLSLHHGSVFQCFENAAWAGDDFCARLQPAGDLNVRLAGDA